MADLELTEIRLDCLLNARNCSVCNHGQPQVLHSYFVALGIMGLLRQAKDVVLTCEAWNTYFAEGTQEGFGYRVPSSPKSLAYGKDSWQEAATGMCECSGVPPQHSIEKGSFASTRRLQRTRGRE